MREDGDETVVEVAFTATERPRRARRRHRRGRPAAGGRCEHARRARPRSPASARPSSPRSRAAPSCSSRASACKAALDDAGLLAARRRRARHLHARLERGDGGRAQPRHRPALDVRRASRTAAAASAAIVMQAAMAVATGAAEVVVCYRAFNERSGMRFGDVGGAMGAAVLPPFLVMVRAVRAAVAGGLGRAARPPLHARVRRHQRGLRAHRRRRPHARGDQPGRVVLRAADHASRTTRRRAGSSSRCCGCSTAARRATAASRSS